MASEQATFAGGCFWCMEPPFENLKGVEKIEVGYTGGHLANPTYEQVSEGGTGHAEAIQITYDPTVVDYQTLINIFWKNIDPTVKDRQFCDVGRQYRSAIFYHNDSQQKLAEASKKNESATLQLPIQTEIIAASEFYSAEEYHQKYHKKNPVRYKFYRYSCGRDKRLKQLNELRSN